MLFVDLWKYKEIPDSFFTKLSISDTHLYKYLYAFAEECPVHTAFKSGH